MKLKWRRKIFLIMIHRHSMAFHHNALDSAFIAGALVIQYGTQKKNGK